MKLHPRPVNTLVASHPYAGFELNQYRVDMQALSSVKLALADKRVEKRLLSDTIESREKTPI